MKLSTAMSPTGSSEDRVVTLDRDDVIAIVVADGAGGRGGGGEAADAFVNAALAWLERSRDWSDVRALSRVFTEADETLWRAGGGETTGIVAIVAADWLCGVSAGDSEAWMISGARIDRLTENQARARIGSSRAAPVAFHRRALLGTLVVATDGLFRHADEAAIVRSCTRAKALVDLPRLPSGAYPDDVGVAVLTL